MSRALTVKKGELSLRDEVERAVRISRGHTTATPMFKNGGGATTKDTVKMAVNYHRNGPDNERC